MKQYSEQYLEVADMRIDMNRFGAEALEAACKAGGEFLDQHGADMAGWTRDRWRHFVWVMLTNGIAACEKATSAEIKRITRGIDDIPFN